MNLPFIAKSLCGENAEALICCFLLIYLCVLNESYCQQQ